MKRVLPLIALTFVLIATGTTLAQKGKYGPHIADNGRNVQKHNPLNSGIANFSSNPPYILYRTLSDPSNPAYKEARFFVDFEIPFDSVAHTMCYPEPEVEWATLSIEYTTAYDGDSTLHLNVYELGERTTTLTDQELWNETEGQDSFPMNDGDWDPTRQMRYIEQTESFAPFKAMIEDAVDNGFLSLGFKLQDHTYLDGSMTWVQSWDIQLEIGFVGHSDVVTITNKINGVVSPPNPESKVRDEQIRLWQQAPYQPTWALWQDHVAETRFWEYFDPTIFDPPPPAKFHHWDGNLEEYFVKKPVNNYNCYPFTFVAETDNHKNTSLKTNFEFTTPWEAEIDFHDPWRVIVDGEEDDWLQAQPDDYKEVHSEFAPHDSSDMHGVFLDQRFYPGHPFYSVRPWKLLEWHDDGSEYTKLDQGASLKVGDGVFYAETHVDFNRDNVVNGALDISPVGSVDYGDELTPNDPYWQYRLRYLTDNTTVTPLYKAHRSSTDIEIKPTGFCSQRKVDIDDEGNYHMVYANSGAIWYCKSTDAGVTWSPEKCVSWGIGSNCKNPSLSVSDNEVFVTFVSDGSGTAQIHLVHTNNGVWRVWNKHTITQIYRIGLTSSPNAHPVVAASSWNNFGCDGFVVVVVWENGDNLDVRYVYADNNDINRNKAASIQTIYTTPNPDFKPIYPAITAAAQPSEMFMVLWTQMENNTSHVYSKTVHAWWWTYSDPMQYNISPVYQVSDASETALFAASVTRTPSGTYAAAYEVLEFFGLYNYRYYTVKKFDLNNRTWNTTGQSVIGATNYLEPLNPSIGQHETSAMCGSDPADGLRVISNINWGGGLEVGVFDCSFSVLQRPNSGSESFANMVPYAPEGDLIDIHSVASFSRPEFPQFIAWGLEGSGDALGKTTNRNYALLRDARLLRDSACALIGISKPQTIDNSAYATDLDWNCAHDSLIVGLEVPMTAKLRTETFTPSAGMKLTCDLVSGCTDYTAFASNVKFTFNIHSAQNNQVLASYSYPVSMMPLDTLLWERPQVNLSPFHGQSIYATIGVAGDTAGLQQAVRKVWMEQEQLFKMQGAIASDAVPRQITLDNFPNPFNPSTDITYGIPEEMEVKLVVYDNWGREVKVLANGWKAAGTHTVTFDAADLPSGMYLYRIETAKGSVSKKMMLMK